MISLYLEELQLIQATLLPDEILTFLDDDPSIWSQLLGDYSENPASLCVDPETMAPPHIQVKPQHSNVWFEVQFPAPDSLPNASVKGENLTRAEQQRWQRIIAEKMETGEINASDFPVYQLLCLHLLPLLHDELDTAPTADPATGQVASGDDPASAGVRSHALFTSHHLISPKKRRALQQWSGALTIAGFAKVGYPGLIYAQGAQPDVEEFVANVKGMQWLALKLRFQEPLPSGGDAVGSEAHGWAEFEKVGEAVEEMRKLGLENWIVEMGVGSKSAAG